MEPDAKAEVPSQQRSGVDPKAVKAVSHRTRFEILRVLEARGVASPSEMARELGEPLGNVSHHVKVLEECECIELVETKPVRGALEHFYRTCMRSVVTDDVSRLLPQEVREQLSGTTLGNIFDRIKRAVLARTVDSRPERHISWMPIEVDEKGWRELIQSKARQYKREMEIQAEVADRRARGELEGSTFPVFTSELAFPMPERGDGDLSD